MRMLAGPLPGTIELFNRNLSVSGVRGSYTMAPVASSILPGWRNIKEEDGGRGGSGEARRQI